MLSVAIVFLWRLLVFPVVSFSAVEASLGRIEHKVEHVEAMTGRIESKISVDFSKQSVGLIQQAIDEVSRGKAGS
jgi:hypothetical protein